MSVVQAKIIFYICNCITLPCAGQTYGKCFQIVLSKKSDSFKKQKDDEQRSFLVQIADGRISCAVSPHLFKCGVLYRLFCLGFVRASYLINETGSTLSFCGFVHLEPGRTKEQSCLENY